MAASTIWAWRSPAPTPWKLSRAVWPGVGLASVEERETTCCYARQDKFWVKGAPDGEQWEIYTVLKDSATFWGEHGEQSWEATEATLGSSQAPPAAGAQCCGEADQAGAPAGSDAAACC